MAKHKRQHFVPQSYLKAWCDPNAAAGQEPYVWRFSKDGSDVRRKAPENLFHETDLYTIRRADGSRNLVLEHGLSQLESEFVSIRDTKLTRREQLTAREHVLLCAFMAAAHVRTPAQRDHHGGQWGRILERMERMREWAKTATPEQKRAMSAFDRIRRADGKKPRTLGYEDVRRMAEAPMQTMLVPMINAQVRHLVRLDVVVMVATGESSFITSDNPCVWYDPMWHTRPPLYQAPALIYPTIEITMPVSPRQRILLNRQGVRGYIPMPDPMVEEANRLTRFMCSEYFVNNTNVAKPLWFDRGVEPDDSWRKRNPTRPPLKPPAPVRELDDGELVDEPD